MTKLTSYVILSFCLLDEAEDALSAKGMCGLKKKSIYIIHHTDSR